MFSTILTLSITISPVISDLDSIWSLDDDPLFSNTELPSVNSDQSLISLNSNAPLFNSAPPFGDAVLSINNDIDPSDTFLWDLSSSIIPPTSQAVNKNNNNNNVDDESNFFDDDDHSFQLADCMTSESLLSAFDISKSRLRKRGGGSQKCLNLPAITPPTNSQASQSSLDSVPGLQDFLERALLGEKLSKEDDTTLLQDPNQNSFCALVTEGQLPWGVCASDRPNEKLQLRDRFNLRLAKESFIMWQLFGATLGTFFFSDLAGETFAYLTLAALFLFLFFPISPSTEAGKTKETPSIFFFLKFHIEL